MSTRTKSYFDKSITGCPEMEYFWAVDLTSENPTMSWFVKDEELEEDDDDDDFIEHTLFVRLAVLGSGAVPGEPNVVLMESMDENGKPIKAVIINLTRGENSMGNLSLTVDGKVGAKFTLVEGSGPVCISGNHLLDYPKADPLDNSQTASEVSEDDDELGEEEEDEDPEEEENEKVKTKPAKRKGGTPKSSRQKQKAKMEVEEDEDEDDDDDEEDIDYDKDEDFEEDADSEEEKAKKKKKKGSSKEITKVQEKGKAKTAAVAKDAGKKVVKKAKK